MAPSTRRRSSASNNAAPGDKKKVLKDVTNGGRGALPRKIPDAGPPTAPVADHGVGARTRSSRKKPPANVGRTGAGPLVAGEPAEEKAEPVKLEAKFEQAADSKRGKNKRKALEVIDNEAEPREETRRTRRVTRAGARRSTGREVDAEKKAVIDLTCDERLVAERGLILATGLEGVGASEEVFPFSVDGGRRSNERKHALAPYVLNGHLFSAMMRQDLVDWMSQQHSSLDLMDETLHLALRYLDTFLYRRGTESFLARNGAGSEPVPALPLGPLESGHVLYLNRGAYQPLCNKLKRLGITCVFVAAKLTEVSAPSAHEFAEAAEVSTFTRSQLLLAERALLRELEYYLYHPTPSSFASAFLSATLPALERRGAEALDPKWGPAGTRWDTGLANEITEMVDYLLETAAVSHLSLDFPPSLLAAASVAWVLTRFYRVDASRLADLEALGGYGIDRDMREAFEFLEKLVKDARRSEKLGRGMNVNDKYPAATSCLWPNEDTDETR